MKRLWSIIFSVVCMFGACTPADQWVVVAHGQDVTEDPSWACTGWLEVENGAVLVAAGDEFRTFVNSYGPRVSMGGDFGVAVTLSTAADNLAAVSLVGQLGQGEWWNETRKLDVGIEQGSVVVNYYDGTSFMPRVTETFAVQDLGDEVTLELRRVGSEFVLRADGEEVGRMDAVDAFPENEAYFGASVRPHNTLTLHKIAVLAPPDTDGVKIVPHSEASAYEPTDPPLRDLAAARAIHIGGAVGPTQLRCERTYGEVLAHEFNILTTENAMKFASIHPELDRYTFEGADTIVDFAEAHDMWVRGHTLVWHQSLPAWIQNAEFTQEAWHQVLHDHITTVVGRYQGRVQVWDVVNEAIGSDGPGNLRSTVWLEGIGPDYIDKAFTWAHEADPHALLFYNDYGGEDMGLKSNQVYNLVQGMLERGIPLHGVGLQMHVDLGTSPNMEQVLQNIQRLGELGLQVHITELDIRLPANPDPALYIGQANLYQELMEVCLTAQACTAFVMWGFTDRHSWIPAFFPGADEALIFDKHYQAKPAYFSLREALTVPHSLGPEDFGASCECEP